MDASAVMDLKTREQLRQLNAQEWSDFKAHWPMHVVIVIKDAAIASLLGAALGFSFVIHFVQASV